MTNAHPTRRFAQLALVALVGLGVMTQAAPALAQGPREPQAEQFVQTRAQRVISVLADKNQSVAQKKATFHAVPPPSTRQDTCTGWPSWPPEMVVLTITSPGLRTVEPVTFRVSP